MGKKKNMGKKKTDEIPEPHTAEQIAEAKGDAMRIYGMRRMQASCEDSDDVHEAGMCISTDYWDEN